MSVLCGLAAPAATAADDGGLLSVLVMGDSYSAGNGAGSYYGPAKCYRSSRNYAREFEREVEKSGQRVFVENVACSGAVTVNFFGRQTVDVLGPRNTSLPGQIHAVNHGYDLIFLTIGGNDLAFADIVTHCLIEAKRSAKDCKPLLDDADKMLAGDVNGRNLERRIRSILFAVKQDADPRAKVVLVGYPHLEGDQDYELTTRGIRQRETVRVGARLRALGREGDKLQGRVVRQLNQQLGGGFVFVSTKALFGQTQRCGTRLFTHELYANYVNCARWLVGPAVNEDVTISKDTYYHPNQRGWREVAQLLARDPRVPKRDLNSGTPPPAGGPAPGLGPGPTPGAGPIPGMPHFWVGYGPIPIRPDSFRTGPSNGSPGFTDVIWSEWGPTRAVGNGTLYYWPPGTLPLFDLARRVPGTTIVLREPVACSDGTREYSRLDFTSSEYSEAGWETGACRLPT